MEDRIEIGRVCRLQIQLSSLKAGPPKGKYFDPAPLREASEIKVNVDGVTAIVDGVERIDVHNATHPETKNRNAINGVSIGFTSHYRRMRDRFGGSITDGIAGENILVETNRGQMLDDLAGGVLIENADGNVVAFGALSVAHPCVEFSRFAMGDRDAPALAVSETLRFLDNGTRGFYARVDTVQPHCIAVGDRVFVRRQS